MCSRNWNAGSWLLSFFLAVRIQFSSSIKILDWDERMICWGSCRESQVAAPCGGLVFMKLGGHYHHYFQEAGVEISVITLAARSDYKVALSSHFRWENALHCVARAGVELARKPRPKEQWKPLTGRDGRAFFSLETLTVPGTLHRATYVQEQMNADHLT